MIKIENLSISFDNKKVIDNLNLTIKKGEKIILNSSSGSGKTSFLRVLQGFILNYSGEIKICNLNLNEKNIKEIRSNISYVSQRVELPQGKVKDILKMIFNYSVNRGIEVKELEKKLQEFNLDKEILERDTKQISGGERQRIGFIISLYLNREIWLLDEITASLDFNMKKKVEEYILNSDKTIILVSHDENWDLSKFKEVKW
ncbi:ATP-binding cassette domain-containing protein [uncultured Cetobacterium sp.]|uniref:ABC transporter ATP-binding protein n=1 Tax=uncultured Cetobacterium sp. TaxID=527638 RepID=UPI002621C275|nr:ATP-binding cassette domain-containing protein [uncultured Cetobacterium sp.]